MHWDTQEIELASSAGAGIANTRHPASMSIVQGNPATAYVHLPPLSVRTIRYIRALDGSGANWPAPRTLRSSSTNNYTDVQLGICNGFPAIAYIELGDSGGQTTYSIRFLRATDATGGSWPNIAVDVSISVGEPLQSVTWTEIGGRPAIAAISGDSILIFYANDANGASWASGFPFYTGSGTLSNVWLANIAGLPGFAFYEEGKGVSYIGSGGAATPEPRVIDSCTSTLSTNNISLVEIGGLAAVTWDAQTPSGPVGVRYSRALDASSRPSFPAFKVALSTTVGGNIFTVYAKDASTPKIVGIGGSLGQTYVEANDPDGVSWLPPEIIAVGPSGRGVGHNGSGNFAVFGDSFTPGQGGGLFFSSFNGITPPPTQSLYGLQDVSGRRPRAITLDFEEIGSNSNVVTGPEVGVDGASGVITQGLIYRSNGDVLAIFVEPGTTPLRFLGKVSLLNGGVTDAVPTGCNLVTDTPLSGLAEHPATLEIYSFNGSAGELVKIDPVTGDLTVINSSLPQETTIYHGLAFRSDGRLFLLSEGSELLYLDAPYTTTATTIGGTGLSGLRSITFDEDDNLWALSTAGGATLARLNDANANVAASSTINYPAFLPDINAGITFGPPQLLGLSSVTAGVTFSPSCAPSPSSSSGRPAPSCDGVALTTNEIRQTLFAEFPTAKHTFGTSVSISGINMAASLVPDGNESTGQVEVYQFIGNWVRQQVISNPEPSNFLRFGDKIAMGSDFLLVEARTATNVKLVIYRFTGVIWDRDQTIDIITDTTKINELVIDGDTFVVSAANASGNYSLQVFVDLGTTFNRQRVLTLTDPVNDNHIGNLYGSGIALSGDTLAVGAAGSKDPTGNDRGAVHIWTRSGVVWTYRTKISTSNQPGVMSPRFGFDVAIDGNTMAVMQTGTVDSQPTIATSIYIYTGSGASWVQQQRLTTTSGDIGDNMGLLEGRQVAVSGDTVFALLFSGSDGACRRLISFKRSGTTWSEEAVFILDQNAEERDSVPVKPHTFVVDGDDMIVGSANNHAMASNAGAVIHIPVSVLGNAGIAASSSTDPDIGATPLNTTRLDALKAADAEVNKAVCEDAYFPADYCYFGPATLLEYGFATQGKWYYRQNKPGTPWFDAVENIKGWTVDFNLRVEALENINALSDTEKPDGLGVYVNDGMYYEVIYFLQQEILFTNANVQVSYDTTATTDYRVIGKGRQLRLFAKKQTEARFKEIASITFNTGASNEGNGSCPAVVQDGDGNYHAAWADDGNQMGQLYYAKFAGGAWGSPQLVVSTRYGLQNPDIGVTTDGKIYIVYESNDLEATNIGFVYQVPFPGDDWSEPQFIGTGTGASKRPRLSVDDNHDLHVVWEDHRFEHPEVFYNKWIADQASWGIDQRVTETDFGSVRPCVATYRETAFISFATRQTNQSSSINLASYNSLTDQWVSSYNSGSDIVVSDAAAQQPDYPDVIVSMGGQVFVNWHDNESSVFEIYNRIFSFDLVALTSAIRVTDSNNDSLYPVLAENSDTADIYVAWEDTRELDPATDPEVDPYLIQHAPHIFIARYDSLKKKWISSGQGNTDVRLNTFDNRSWSSPGVSPAFTGDLHIVYQAQMAIVEDEYQKTTEMFSTIRDAVYDLSTDVVFNVLADPYAERDQLVSDKRLRKEIRFGDFSNVLSSAMRFGNIGFYTDDAVEPFEISPVSNREFDIESFSVNDASVNVSGDAWLATSCGVIFYFDEDGSITVLQDANINGKDIRSIAFDKNNVMWVIVEDSLFYSTDHITFNAITVAGATTPGTLDFDRDNNLLIGTADGGLVVADIEGDFSVNIQRVLTTELPSLQVNVVKGDDNGVIWIGTNAGLVRFFNGSVNIFNAKNGMLDERINDIAIRNGAIRYLGTASGLLKMTGSTFESINSQDFGVYNNNVKSVTWQDPNILWVGTLSRLNQVVVDDGNNNYDVIRFNPDDYSHFETTFDDQRTYFVITDEMFDGNCVVEVFLNGHQITQGFDVSLKGDQNPKLPFSMIKFKTNLMPADRVDVRIRDDIRQVQTFVQSEKEKATLGASIVRVKDIDVSSGLIFVVTEGDVNEVRSHDFTGSVDVIEDPYVDPYGVGGGSSSSSSSSGPDDEVELDTTPPTGEIEIVEQIDATTLRVRINNATDGGGSGLDKMVISNFTNFTLDGSTAQGKVPFDVVANQPIESFAGDSADELIFSNQNAGKGSVIQYFENNELYAATGNPGAIFRFDSGAEKWNKLVTFASNESVDFIEFYNGMFVVGVGTSAGAAKLYAYADNTFTDPQIFPLDGNNLHGVAQLNNMLYVGSSPVGKIYSFDGDEATLVVSGVASNILSMTAFGENLYVGTGDAGRIYAVDPLQPLARIIHTDSDTQIAAIQHIDFNGDKVFAGTLSEGKIVRSDVDDIVFNVSFRTIPSKTSALKVFNGVLYGAVGNTLYFLDSSGAWTWRFTHTQVINDIAFDTFNSVIYVVSDSKISSINTLGEERCVFLKLVDKAGNETILFDAQSNIVPALTDCITIADLQAFVNENKILELDPYGGVVFSLTGDDPFFAGERIDEERGVYLSEVFNGTNDLIKWDKITWKATQPNDTDVLIFVRSSANSNDIALQEFEGPFTLDQATGVDVGFLNGQFIQFKAELKSRAKGISPSLHRVTIQAVTSKAIHFFTTNFVLGSKITKGILTSQKLLPIAADVVFGINQTNSVDFADYQIIDENRIFNLDCVGDDMRVGIKFISPARSLLTAAEFDEYGPYGTDLFINTVDFNFVNTGGSADTFHFRVTFYDDIAFSNKVFEASTRDDVSGFSVDGVSFPTSGKTILAGGATRVLFTPPGSANLNCDTFYFVQIDKDDGSGFLNAFDTHAFIAGCTASFIDTIDFQFQNTTGDSDLFHFRIRFYEDAERTILSKTIFSGNDRSGWFANDIQIPEDGAAINNTVTANILFRPDLESFAPNKVFYLVIDAFNGTSFILESNSFTFVARDISSLIYCGAYADVPVVKNFGLMFELENNKFVTLNLT